MKRKSYPRAPIIHAKKVLTFCQFLSAAFIIPKEYVWEWIPRLPGRKKFTDMDARPEIPDSVYISNN